MREVAERFGESHGHARTTVLTLMERLRGKGYLTRVKVEGVNRYSPSVPRGELQHGLIRDSVQRALGGSVSPFVAYLAQEGRASDAEIAELEALVKGLRARREGGRMPRPSAANERE